MDKNILTRIYWQAADHFEKTPLLRNIEFYLKMFIEDELSFSWAYPAQIQIANEKNCEQSLRLKHEEAKDGI